jgi:hypothetical protein
MGISYQKITGKVTPLDDDILVHEMETGGKKLSSGLITLDDTNFHGFGETDSRNGRGIRNRWAKVYKVGKNVSAVSVGDLILIEHGRWTHVIELHDENNNTIHLQKIDPNAIIVIQSQDQ